jgi:coproporphyrinogen III oxidase
MVCARRCDIRWDGLSKIQRKEQKRGCEKMSLAGIIFREAPWVEEERQGGGGRMRMREGEVGGGGG